MKIYHVLTNQKKLTPTSGDRLNEIGFLSTVSRFAEVYYNDQRFEPNREHYGLEDREITLPTREYDVHCVRNNPSLFYELPHPKVWVSYPYDEEAFRTADAVLTFNETWKRRLETYNDDPTSYQFFCGAYPPKIVPPKRVINIGQTVDSRFCAAPDDRALFRYRARFGYGFTVGYFGRIVKETLPVAYLRALPRLEEAIPGLRTVFAGSIRTRLGTDAIQTCSSIPFGEMPSATAACDVLLSNEQPEANWAGSVKPLEAMACGVPIVLSKRPSRVDQLGEDYPLYFNNEDDLAQKVVRLYEDKPFYADVQRYLRERSVRFLAKSRATDLEAKFRALLAS